MIQEKSNNFTLNLRDIKKVLDTLLFEEIISKNTFDSLNTSLNNIKANIISEYDVINNIVSETPSTSPSATSATYKQTWYKTIGDYSISIQKN